MHGYCEDFGRNFDKTCVDLERTPTISQIYHPPCGSALDTLDPQKYFFSACLTTPLLFHDMLNRIRALELFWELHSSHSYNVCFYCVGTANIPHRIQTIYVRLT